MRPLLFIAQRCKRVWRTVAQQVFHQIETTQIWLSRVLQRLFLGPPALRSVNDLEPLCEHFTINEGNGDLEFLRSSFAYVTKDHTVYFGRSPSRKYHLTTQIATKCLVRVPDEDIFPKAPAHISVVAHNKGFFKGPMLTAYDELQNTGLVATMLLQEAEICERLKAHPHPNVMQYYGCKVRRGRIVGLLLETYPTKLEDYLSEEREELELKLGFDGIRNGVHHLHTLSYAHNDIKPNNIMVGNDGIWVLIDMGSCLPFGSTLTSAGTTEWYDETWTTSELQHDEIALSKLWTWLEKEQSRKQ